ncbi:hypothetical protein [Mucisphaera sp.]|uniref:hypothetical protein n=1 Tax=Mucisphaera sp. TaxID=2913024 RepID=UPI003D0CFAD8
MTTNVNEGQCGLCKHFAAHSNVNEIQQIRVSKQAPTDLTEECAHPKNVPLQLMVTPISSCSGFESAVA